MLSINDFLNQTIVEVKEQSKDLDAVNRKIDEYNRVNNINTKILLEQKTKLPLQG